MAETLVATAVGEFGTSFLAKEATKVGIKQFIQTYGSTAFQRVSPVIMGGMIAAKVVDAYPPVDLQKEKLYGTSLGSLPGMPTTYYDDTTHKSVPVPTGEGDYIGDTGQKEAERERILQEEKKKYDDIRWGEREEINVPTSTGHPPLTPEKWEPPVNKPIEVPQLKGFPDQSEEFNKPQIFYSKKDDISEQTKKLVPEKPKFGKLTKTEIQTAKALKEGKSDFYSRVVESIKNAKPDKLTKTKWKSYIESTKDEMDYLGLTEFLQGNESITKKELLKFVEEKNIAPNITVRSIPKDEMNKMYEGYSLGGDQEHIVFQIPKGKWELFDNLFKSEHFDEEYGIGNFAHARVQVGFDEGFSAKYDDLSSEVIDTLNNTLIIDEIQSDWLQKGQDKGFISEWKILKGDEITEEFLEKNYPGEYKIEKAPEPTSSIFRILAEAINQNGNPTGVWTEIQRAFTHRYYIFNKEGLYLGQNFKADSFEEAEAEIAKRAVPDFPVKESKKWVELVLNKMIEKAILDGRDSIAITNGQIQYNRYDAQPEKEKQGLKKFYDTIVYDQLEKISDKYNVELERINITEGEASNELQDIHLDNQIKIAQDDGFVLKKVDLQFLWDRTMDTNIPGHAALYSDAGVGQGSNYIQGYLNDLVDNKTYNDKDEVYIWIKEREISPNRIGWELPIVPVNDAHTTVVSTTEMQQHLETSSNQDLEIYSLYLKGIEPPQGEEINPEQLIKMKLPKKLQKERLSKPIKLTKAKQQTERLFA